MSVVAAYEKSAQPGARANGHGLSFFDEHNPARVFIFSRGDRGSPLTLGKKLKLLKCVALFFVGAVAAYYIAFGILYFAGYRVYRFPTNAMQPTIKEKEMAIGRLSESYRSRVKRFDIAIY